MKKKLVAIAVAGLLAAPLAHAQTANVTIYGRINMDVDFISSADKSSLGKLNRVSSNTSRVGFKGTESLGGGLNAIFQIESQFMGDTGNAPNALASRDTWLGLQGNWGAVKLGYMTTPYDTAHAVFGNTNTALTSILQTGALWGQHGRNDRMTGSFGARTANSVRYDSPAIAGFSGQAQYSTDETTNHGWVGSVGLFYDNAGLQAAAVYETNQEWRGNDLDDNAYTVMAGYNFGVVRPALVYEHIEYDTPASGTLKRDLFGGSVTVPLGQGKLYGAVIYADKGKGAKDGTAVGAVRAGKDTGATQYELSYSYELSKRTVAYVGYVYIDNAKNANYTFGHNGNGLGVKAGVDQQGLILGAVHFF
ncbi:MAG: porin [Proteobacteria bacterium]|nr:porin [Pseudomonadota bacterium]MCL2310410.1 porin [Pseudomonadota bacterium]